MCRPLPDEAQKEFPPTPPHDHEKYERFDLRGQPRILRCFRRSARGMQLRIRRLHHTFSRIPMKPTLSSLVTFFVIVQIAILALASFSFAEKVNATEIGKRLEASANVPDQIMSSRDMTIASQDLAEAKC